MASSVAPVLKSGLVTMLTTAFADEPTVRVSYGHPGLAPEPDLVGVMGVLTEQETATLGNRSREETLRVAVTVSCAVGGGPEAQQAATERAYALLADIESALRTDPTVGGACRMAVVEGADLAEDIWWAEAYDPPVAVGRVAEITATIRAVARI